MTRLTRTLLLGLVGALALLTAGAASAAYTTPKLTVQTNGAATTINYTQSASDDPTAKLTFYAPTSYSATLTQSAGQTIGTVTAQGTAADLGGALLPLTGTVQVRAASGTYLSGTTQVPISAAATQCTGTATHTAYWVLILQAAGQTLELPVFVDSPAAPPQPGASASAFASTSIQACLPPPDVPAGTPGRATFGFKLTAVDFRVNNVFSYSGTGEPRWRVLATPYTPGTGRPNAAGSVEAQSVVAFPRSLTLRKPAVRPVRGVVTLRISGVANLPAGAPATLRLYRGAKSASSPSIVLRKSGNAYTGTLRILQSRRAAQVVFLQTRATVGAGTPTCTPTFGVPCQNATQAGLALRSNTVRIVIPRRR
jgi:hypothetical protein